MTIYQYFKQKEPNNQLFMILIVKYGYEQIWEFITLNQDKIKYIPNKDEHYFSLLRYNLYWFKHLVNPSLDVINYAVEMNRKAIAYVENPTPETITKAINNFPNSVKYCKYITDDHLNLAFKLNPNLKSIEHICSFENLNPDQLLYVMKIAFGKSIDYQHNTVYYSKFNRTTKVFYSDTKKIHYFSFYRNKDDVNLLSNKALTVLLLKSDDYKLKNLANTILSKKYNTIEVTLVGND